MDAKPGYTMRQIAVPDGITVNGALVALMQDNPDGLIVAELRIDGPPVP